MGCELPSAHIDPFPSHHPFHCHKAWLLSFLLLAGPALFLHFCSFLLPNHSLDLSQFAFYCQCPEQPGDGAGGGSLAYTMINHFQSLREVRAGIQGGNLKSKIEAEAVFTYQLFTYQLLVASSACCVFIIRDHHPIWHFPNRLSPLTSIIN